MYVCVCVILRPRACELHSIIWMLHFYGEEPPASEKRRKNVEHICVRHWINNNGIRKKTYANEKRKRKINTTRELDGGTVWCCVAPGELEDVDTRITYVWVLWAIVPLDNVPSNDDAEKWFE